MNEDNSYFQNYLINFEEDKKNWDQFVKCSPQRSIFVTSKFLDSLEHNYQLVSLSKKGRILIGAVILLDNEQNPTKQILPFTQYQGILFSNNNKDLYYKNLSFNHKILEYFLSILSTEFKNINLCNSWRLTDLRAFQWFNYGSIDSRKFKIELLYTGILQLSEYENFEHYLKNIRSVRRQEFKKSQKNLKLIKSFDVEALVSLYKLTFKRQGLKVKEEELALISTITTQAIKQNFGRMYLAYFEKVLISAVFFLFDDRTAFYLIGASDPAYRNYYGSTFLLLNVIKEQFDESPNEIDFVGTNSPNRGDYKLSFNCRLTQFSNLTL